MRYSILIISCVILCSCNMTTEFSEQKIDLEFDQSFKDEHNSRNSLDWAGVYTGILPCADCEGIQTKVELQSNFTYCKTIRYIGKSQKKFEAQGKFSWDKEGGKIRLQNQEQPNSYKVVENALIALGLGDKEIEGDLKSNYRLEKENAE